MMLTRVSVGKPEAGPATLRRVERSLAKRLWHHPGGRCGLLLAALLGLVAALGPLLAPYDPDRPSYAEALRPPSLTHLAGTDATGRDMLSRLIDGAHRTLGPAVLVVGAVVAIGLAVGIAAALSGGIADALAMRTVDIVMTVPGLVLAYATLGLIGPGFLSLVVALIISDWAYFARLARSYALGIRARPYIQVARMAGISPLRILLTHILPGVAVPLAVVASIDVGTIVGVISGFSFLGLGVQPPAAEWGSMLAESRFYFTIAPWLLIGPAAMIVTAVLTANLVGTALRDVLDPKATK